MFAKPQKTSGSSLLKNKDVKKLRKDVTAHFSATCAGDDTLALLLPSKGDVKKVSFQAPSRMVVYTVDATREPMLFDSSGKGDFCFTVYALWRAPQVLPKLVVHAPVSGFVLRGADVMLPGVVFTSMDEVASLHKGELRAVYARGNPMPFAVGEMLVDAADIERHGKKGKGLRLLHCVGDELWQMGPKTVPNEGFAGDRVVPIDTSGNVQDVSDDDDEDETEEVGDEDKTDELEVKLEDVTLDDREEEQEVAAETVISKEDMDQLYIQTLLQVLKAGRIKEKELPMLASTFYASVLLPNRAAGVSLNIKQSSFKKSSVFLKQMAARGLLQVSEKDGIQTITSISRRHPDVIDHELYRTEEEAKNEEDASTNAAAGRPAFIPGQFAPEVEEYLGLNQSLKIMLLSDREHVDAHFQDAKDKKYWTAVEVRDAIAKYVDVNELVDVRDKKFIKLNGSMTDALFGKKAPADGGYPERMTRADVLKQLLSKCQRYHRVKLYPGHEPKLHGGDIRPVTIHAERSKSHANSITTSIAFYQQFGIDGTQFAKEAQKKWGCSATTQPSPDKQKGEEIKVQGQMVNEVLEHLATTYKINTAKYCEVSYGKNVKAKKKK
ncbi:Ligatin, partial [Globisporangium splendens]